MVSLVLAGVILVLCLLMVWERRRSDALLADFVAQFAKERAELISAVKSPTYLPQTGQVRAHPEPRSPRDHHALAAIGTVGVAKPKEPEDDNA